MPRGIRWRSPRGYSCEAERASGRGEGKARDVYLSTGYRYRYTYKLRYRCRDGYGHRTGHKQADDVKSY